MIDVACIQVTVLPNKDFQRLKDGHLNETNTYILDIQYTFCIREFGI